MRKPAILCVSCWSDRRLASGWVRAIARTLRHPVAHG